MVRGRAGSGDRPRKQSTGGADGSRRAGPHGFGARGRARKGASGTPPPKEPCASSSRPGGPGQRTPWSSGSRSRIRDPGLDRLGRSGPGTRPPHDRGRNAVENGRFRSSSRAVARFSRVRHSSRRRAGRAGRSRNHFGARRGACRGRGPGRPGREAGIRAAWLAKSHPVLPTASHQAMNVGSGEITWS